MSKESAKEYIVVKAGFGTHLVGDKVKLAESTAANLKNKVVLASEYKSIQAQGVDDKKQLEKIAALKAENADLKKQLAELNKALGAK